MDFMLPGSQKQYGLGERQQSSFELGEGAWGMYASGHNGLESPDDGLGRGGEFGVHPFILIQTKNTQQYVGMFFRSSSPMVPITRRTDDGKNTILSFIALGGQLEVYFFIHGSARQVIADYHKLIGKPQLPPYWALGWQEANFVYGLQSIIESDVKLYKDLGLPLETVYL